MKTKKKNIIIKQLKATKHHMANKFTFKITLTLGFYVQSQCESKNKWTKQNNNVI